MKMVPSDGSYVCNWCSGAPTSSSILYKVNVVVDDGIDVVTIVLLNRVAERLIDSSATKLFKKFDSSVSEFPKEIFALQGKRYVFRLQLNAFNLVDGGSVFTACDAYVHVEDLELKFKRKISAKVDKTACPSTGDTSVGNLALRLDDAMPNEVLASGGYADGHVNEFVPCVLLRASMINLSN